ncbi:hypothetical protein [Desulfotalea psychrophila]|uniref:Uncharacterized protein n=1 Tax=Desulfotalea psychrophila (strain LSv54 / DSM 12343) TaxID=177439 RepID=Q6AP03_DESPS|nr:hypothetical protein [Desulfotalea psychrophila]CAG35921.1 unknown protein [Desulfotalea psychrophila LSv54]
MVIQNGDNDMTKHFEVKFHEHYVTSLADICINMSSGSVHSMATECTEKEFNQYINGLISDLERIRQEGNEKFLAAKNASRGRGSSLT